MNAPRRFSIAYRIALLSLIVPVLLAAAVLRAQGSPSEPAPTADPTGDVLSSWEEVDRLVSEQKLQAALDHVGRLREAARDAGDNPEWTRALIEETKLRVALHEYETAVRFLREQPWPEDPTSRAALDLQYADALIQYVRRYGWQVRQRERVTVDEEIDLKSWTLEQVVAEVDRAYDRLWRARVDWGGEPIGVLARYIDQNDYPARIRGTLRDAVSYLWAERLIDESLWRPEQSNELFRLDLEGLLSGDVGSSATIDLTAGSGHPVVKICAILDDLEAWHRMAGRKEAALEARLGRLRLLDIAFRDNPEDRRTIRRSLESTLTEFDRSYDWWSMGQAQLAEFLREESSADALIRAREAALAGAERHPGSLGARRCTHIVARIEAPSYSIVSMKSDGPDQRSIRIEHRNLPRLYFRAWRYDLEEVLGESRDRQLLPTRDEARRFVEDETPDVTWEMELPATLDYRSHVTYASAPIAEPGAYLVGVSTREDFGIAENELQAVNLIVGDLVLVTRPLTDEWEATARSGATGNPLAGVEVLLYRMDWNRGHEVVARERTGPDGIARIRSTDRNRSHILLARSGAQVALDQNHLRRGSNRTRTERTRAFLYTDRSVYRPGQTVHWKVVGYAGGGEDLRYETLPQRSVVVELIDANRQIVAADTLETNGFGSASGEFLLPRGRLLGSWRLRASLGGATTIQVEEYKRPTFEVEVGDPTTPLRLNRPATLAGNARYYFGLPVTSGQVDWRITRRPIYPRWWWWQGPTSRPQIVATGETPLSDDGRFEIGFTPEVDERGAAEDGISYNYELQVDVTDEGGETRSATRNFRLGFVTVQGRIESDQTFFMEGRPGELTVSRTDLDGTPRPGSGSWRLIRLKQPDRTVLPADEPLPFAPGDEDPYRTAGDRLRPRWDADVNPDRTLAQWEAGDGVAAAELEHGDDGVARLVLPRLEAGAYRLHYETEDDFGATCRERKEILVAGTTHTPVALPLVLRVEQTSVPVGGTARILVRSGLPDQEIVFELFRDGRRFERRTLRSGVDAELIEIPITTGDRGGFGISVSALRDHQFLHQSEQIFVPWDDRKLTVEFATFRDRLRPGTKETFRVTVRGDDEEQIASGTAELLAYMYDRSLDLFAPHHPADPLRIYPRRTGTVRASITLGPAPPAWRRGNSFASFPDYPYLREDRLKSIDGYGVGGPGRGRARGQTRSFDLTVSTVQTSAAIGLEAGVALSCEVSDEVQTSSPSPPPFAPARPELSADAATPEAPVQLRSDFSETAFFLPHLRMDKDGAATIEFEVPDAVTDWNVWVHALTRDLRSGSGHRQASSVKELMVRPYLPRFLREGDQAEIQVVVHNAGDEPLTGTLDFVILDPDTEEDLGAAFGLDPADAHQIPFTAPPGGSSDLGFSVKVPARIGPVAFRATARAGAFSDGEIRSLPVLPGRLHLTQSRFVTLRDEARREMYFADLAAADDPTRIQDQMVVTVDAQLFYSVLNALPYLVEYPYECSEQLLNKFVSTGIVASLYDDYPAVARMAKQFSGRQTRFETWNAPDPNRKMALEESPWLLLARGGEESPNELIDVLDPTVARATRDEAIAKLANTQTSAGAFPWWPGGPPSPYMTLYVLYGLSKAQEFGVDVPKPMVVKAWSYLHAHYLDGLTRSMRTRDCCWETITYLNYVLSNYPDDSWTEGIFTEDERTQMLDYSFGHWREHSPLLKGYLALTLARADRMGDATLVFDSVMDSAKHDEDLGTYWAPEDRAWLWYNDTIETHAFALRTLVELRPNDLRRHGLAQWLLLNKKLGHWKSTRATAEAIYALVHYLKMDGAIAVREEVDVDVGPRNANFVFDPDAYTGARNRLVIPGEEINPATMSTIVVEKATPGFAFASATWHFSTEQLPDEARGDLFAVTRSYYRRVNTGNEWVLEPLDVGVRIEPGDQIEVQLSIRAKHAAEYVHLRDPRGAGFEPETTTSRYRWDLGLGWYEEIRDSGANFFFEHLPAGEYTLRYRLRANMAGRFRVGPATLQSMYAPEFTAYSAGEQVEVRAPGR